MANKVINSPTIEWHIREYLANKGAAASLAEIYDYVQTKATIQSKTPRNTISATIYRMPDVEREGKARYRHVSR